MKSTIIELKPDENKNCYHRFFKHSNIPINVINQCLQQCTHIILFFKTTTDASESQCESVNSFTLVQIVRPKIFDILMMDDKFNEETYCNDMLNLSIDFAISRGCKRIFIDANNPVRKLACLRLGFEHMCGIPKINEVLEKRIKPSSVWKSGN